MRAWSVARDRDVLAFEERASRYDEGWLAGLHHQIADRTADVAGRCAAAPHRVLDVGSGTGYLLGQLAERLPDTASLIGVDPAHQMVAVASRRSTDRRVSMLRGVAERLPFADGTFDLVVSTTSFDHWKDQRAGLGECARVLVPGGRLVLTDQFSNWLLPTMLAGRRGKARTQRRANDLMAAAGFHSIEWRSRFGGIMRTVAATT
jgi:ubiquinone/menaquinone biosynthesis C-methylase UbiE